MTTAEDHNGRRGRRVGRCVLGHGVRAVCVQATHVVIDLRLEQRRVRLRITDNGHGFDPAAAADDGNGLGSMHRRAQSLGGRLTITSRPGDTTIEADVPYTRHAGAAAGRDQHRPA